MAVLTAGSGQQFTTIAAAVAASHDGDTIYVKAGTYLDDYLDITTKINIVGVGGMVHLVSDQLIPNDEAYVRIYSDAALDHFEFSGATVSPSRANGSGIRFVHGNLTITNSYFHDNEEGIRSGADTGTIIIDRTEFAHNGSGNGQTHNIYIGRIASLTVTNSYLHDAVTGHELKSRAQQTIVSDNRIFDNYGNASYSIDLPVGGVGIIQNNIIQQGPNSPNGTIIAYAAEDVPAPGSSLLVSHNTIINQLTASSPFGVRNFSTDVIASIDDNKIYGLDPASIAKGPNEQSGNETLTSAPALDFSHPWDASPWDDLVSGGDGNDTLAGVAGRNLLLVGGNGSDLFHIAAGEANATIADFMTSDAVNLDGYGFADFAAIAAAMTQTGDGVVLALGNGEILTFLDRQLGDFAAGDFVFTGSPPPPPAGTIGGPLNDLLTGTASADVLDGLAGSDTMDGGAGDDSYSVDNVHDRVNENAGEGADTVTTSLSAYVLPENAEDFLFAGSGGFAGTGNAENNAITGSPGDDSLDGGAGADTLTGGPGNDTYVIDGTGDQIVENPGAGIDTVKTNLNNYVLAANFENLVFMGSGSFTGIGNSDSNDITGGPEHDSLDGLSGADTMRGGLGDDFYFVDDAADLVKEIQNGGVDTIFTTLTNYTVAKYTENLAYVGNSDFTGIGTTGNNTLAGAAGNDTLNALGGNDTLAGRGGADTLDGGAGVDTAFYVQSAGGVNVSLSTGQNFGGDAQGDVLLNIENLTGSAFDDTLEGSSANNSLDGGGGIDTLSYEHAPAAVKISLASTSSQTTGGAGSDRIFQFRVSGSSFADSLTGSTTGNVLTGLSGNDTLLGGLGADTLIGGAGNDLYIVDNSSDVTTENPGEGVDIVQTSVTYTLGDNVETLVQTGSAAINATGNNGANSINGNAKANVLSGLDGNDTLSGLAGNDTLVGGGGLDVLTGGNGVDRFTFTAADAPSGGAIIGKITDFIHSQTDKIDLSAIDANGTPGSAFTFPGGSPSGAFTHQAGQLHYVANGSGGVNVEGDINGDGNADFVIIVDGVASLAASDFVL